MNEWHKKNYGDNFLYQDFASQFKADLFDPNEWADIFQSSGAKYIVFTTKVLFYFILFYFIEIIKFLIE